MRFNAAPNFGFPGVGCSRHVVAAVTATVVIAHEAKVHRIAEHHQIFDAIAEGDPKDAARLMRTHVRASDQRSATRFGPPPLPA
jgi:DNA-binding GntR family transcriptional regulator